MTDMPVENIYTVDTPLGGVFVRSYVASSGGSALVVDTGLAETAGQILELLRSLGLPKVAAIVHTHGHWDHIGGTSAIRAETGCIVAAHGDDAEMVASRTGNDRRFLNRFAEFPPDESEYRDIHSKMGAEPTVDMTLNGGEVFVVGDMELEIVPMPGHTPGCIGILDKSSGALISGDALQGRGIHVNMAQYEDVRAYRQTIEMVAKMGVKTLLSAHTLPFSGDVLKGFLEDSLDEVSVIEQNIKNAKSEIFEDMVREVCAKMGKPVNIQAQFTIRAHMDDLKIS